MKRTLFLSAAMLLCLAATAVAQPGNQSLSPEQKTLKSAENMAAKLLLSDEQADRFIPLYVEFKNSQRAINEKYRTVKKEGEPKARQTDAEVEKSLRNQMDKSQEILDLRKAYLDKYLKVLSARQVRDLYKLEKDQQAHHGKHPGQHKGNNAKKSGTPHRMK